MTTCPGVQLPHPALKIFLDKKLSDNQCMAGYPNFGPIQISVQRFHLTVSHSAGDFGSKAVLLLWVLAVACSCCPYLYFGSSIMLVTYFVNFR